MPLASSAVIFESELRDALWVNWALPRRALPPVPEPLSVELLGSGESEVGFVSLVLFQQRRLRVASLPVVCLSFPQCNLRLLTRDAERVASVLFLRELMPAWVVPVARMVAGQPASAAIFHVDAEPGGVQRWRFEAGERLELLARPGAPAPAPPLPGSWPETVAFFRERSRGYVRRGGGLRRLTAAHPGAEGLPMRVEVTEASWLAARLPEVDVAAWSRPHSAFLIPSILLSVAVEAALESAPAEPIAAPTTPAVT
jgi:hypothetical protein